jgi:hypothetical protein
MDEVVEVSGGYPVHLSFLVDNNDADSPEISFKIGPRIGRWVGKKKQKYKDQLGNVLGDAVLNWYSDKITEFPVYYQDIRNENFELEGVDSEKVLVYGEADNDFWNLYLKEKKIMELLSQPNTFNFYMNPSDYDLIEIEREAMVLYNGEYISGLIDRMRYDHTRGTGKITVVTPIETSQFYENVFTEVNDLLCSDNKPELLYTAGPTEVFSIGGSSVYPISQVTYEVQDVDDDGTFGTSWIQLTTTGSNTAEYANPLKRHRVRMTVKYSPVNGVQCGDKILILEIDPCGNYTKPELQVGFDAIRSIYNLRRVNLVNSLFFQTVTEIRAKISRPVHGEETYTIDINTLLGDWVEVDIHAFPNITLTELEVDFANGCQYVLEQGIDNSELPTFFITNQVLQGDIGCEKKGIDPDGGKYVPKLDDIILGKQPEEIRYIVKNDDWPDGITWNEAMGPVGKNPHFRAAFQFVEPDEILYTDWIDCNALRS